MIPPRRFEKAFTLIELLTVIAIIAILMGLLFPAIGAVKESARKTQAKNDELQIVTAVKAYYTEYGKYPITNGSSGADQTLSAPNRDLFYVLKASATGANAADVLNPRKIVFMEAPDAKNPAAATATSGIDSAGDYHDPWGGLYQIMMDGSYDNQLTNPYTSNAGSVTLTTGVIAWAFGKDKLSAGGDKNAGTSADDVISWQ